jgi:RHS repeat-associated protein
MTISKLTGGNIYYFHQDQLGSTRLVTTGSTTSFSSNYQAFGQQYLATGTDPTYKYTGKPQDSGTGLYYYAARYYDSSIGRFITRDPASQPLTDPQTHALYPYVKDNPETFTDSSGQCLDKFGLCLAIIGLGLDIIGLGTGWSQRVQLAWNFFWNYALPAFIAILRGDIWGFVYSVIGGLLWHILPVIVLQLPWWQVGFFIFELGSNIIYARLLFAMVNFIWSIMWELWNPFSPGFCW